MQCQHDHSGLRVIVPPGQDCEAWRAFMTFLVIERQIAAMAVPGRREFQMNKAKLN